MVMAAIMVFLGAAVPHKACAMVFEHIGSEMHPMSVVASTADTPLPQETIRLERKYAIKIRIKISQRTADFCSFLETLWARSENRPPEDFESGPALENTGTYAIFRNQDERARYAGRDIMTGFLEGILSGFIDQIDDATARRIERLIGALRRAHDYAEQQRTERQGGPTKFLKDLRPGTPMFLVWERLGAPAKRTRTFRKDTNETVSIMMKYCFAPGEASNSKAGCLELNFRVDGILYEIRSELEELPSRVGSGSSRPPQDLRNGGEGTEDLPPHSGQ
jgi:hypothetical protein